MFGLVHNLYMAVSFLLTIILLVIFNKFVKNEKHKHIILRVTAILVVAIHFSVIWVEYLKNGSAEIESPMLFPIYPCNVIMWMLLITSSIKKKDNTAYRILSEFTAIGGIVCGTIGIILNENFIRTPSLMDYDVLAGMLSHSVMVFGCLYLIVSGFVKVRVFNVVSCACGLTYFIINGGIINLIYYLCKLDSCNSMYMLEVPFESMPWLTPYLMGVVALVLVFIVTAIYEFFALKKEDRWYNKFKPQIEDDEILVRRK